jgi:hypothetical protein
MKVTKIVTAIVAAAALAAGTGACGTTVMRVVGSPPIVRLHRAIHAVEAKTDSELSRWFAPSANGGASHPPCENPATRSVSA